jgi:putative transposase
LKEAESGRLVKEACREHGISDATYYNWKTEYVAWKRLMSSGLTI